MVRYHPLVGDMAEILLGRTQRRDTLRDKCEFPEYSEEHELGHHMELFDERKRSAHSREGSVHYHPRVGVITENQFDPRPANRPCCACPSTQYPALLPQRNKPLYTAAAPFYTAALPFSAVAAAFRIQVTLQNPILAAGE